MTTGQQILPGEVEMNIWPDDSKTQNSCLVIITSFACNHIDDHTKYDDDDDDDDDDNH